MARAAGDTETEQLARQIQEEERRTAEKVWSQIAPCAVDALDSLFYGEERAKKRIGGRVAA